MYFRLASVASLLCLFVVVGCSQDAGETATVESQQSKKTNSTRARSDFPIKMQAKHLPNAVRVHEKVISGGLPENDLAFEELRQLGVKTIISVDGAKPDVETAEKFGLRYVHLPHGYDGISDDRAMELAKAVRDLEGPIYIHCHHGKHRSPAAASVACVSAGLIPPASAISVLEIAGTSENYRGLYQSANDAMPFEEALLNELQVEFRESVDVLPMAEAMVAIGHTHDHLKAISQARWRTPAEQPDLDPAHEALMLREHFSELLRDDDVKQQPEQFQELIVDSEIAAKELESILREFESDVEHQNPPKTLQSALDRISQNCKSCHQKYRDIPLDEKNGNK